jgi:hypothetical protein
MKRLLLACLLLGPAPAPAGAPPSPAELVRQLGDDSFEVRRAAGEKLAALGAAAVSAVRAGLKDRDPEVRRQCRLLLPRLLAADREAKFKAFLADTEGKQKHDLPGWKRFGQVVGTKPAERRLFVRAVRADVALLETAQGEVKGGNALLAKRCADLQLHLITPERKATIVGELAALAFVLTDARLSIERRSLAQFHAGMETLANRPPILKEVRADPALCKLLLAALKQRSAPAPDKALSAAQALSLKGAVDWALPLATDRKAPAGTRAAALLLIGALGDRRVSDRLAPLLTDTTVVGSRALGRARLSAEVRDVALAALIQLHGQSTADYSYPYSRAVPGLKVVPEAACLGFTSPAEREAAFKRWRERTTKK